MQKASENNIFHSHQESEARTERLRLEARKRRREDDDDEDRIERPPEGHINFFKDEEEGVNFLVDTESKSSKKYMLQYSLSKTS